MNKSDTRLLMLATFRYSLGRRTYMPGFIVEQIIKHHELFNKRDWNQFIEEINSAGDLGDQCDSQTWNKLIEFSKKQNG